jgi:diguanylate cyclase (GGDEF)-like protein/PAS domain S-box-containing protein
MVDDVISQNSSELRSERHHAAGVKSETCKVFLKEVSNLHRTDDGSKVCVDGHQIPAPPQPVIPALRLRPTQPPLRRRVYRDQPTHEPKPVAVCMESDDGIFRLLVENSTDVLVLADSQLQRAYVSPSCYEVMGYHQSELVGRTPTNLIHPDDKDRVMSVFAGLSSQSPTASASWRMLRANGQYRWMETTYRRLPDARIISAVRDIQSRKEIEEQLAEALERVEQLAMHDSLTNLPNRRSFLEAVEKRLAGTADPLPCAVLLIDLNQFKPINDIYGHAAGDQVLIEVADRLRTLDSFSIRFARLGGDEFAALVCNADPASVELLAHQIIKKLSSPFLIGRIAIELGASIGIAVSSRAGTDTVALLRHADAAMYHTKRGNRSGYHFFDPSMDGATLDNVELQMQLRDAIDAGEIVPYYHPLVDLQNEGLVGLEALARWEHPLRGTLSPVAFIDLVERMGLFDKLFDLILRRACKDAVAWPNSVRLSINLSPSQLTDPKLPGRMGEILRLGQFSPDRLVIEVTENLPVATQV